MHIRYGCLLHLPDVTIEIDNKTLTVDEAKALNYKVPLFVKLTENAGLTALEFGVEVADGLTFNIDNKCYGCRRYCPNASSTVPAKSEERRFESIPEMTTADSDKENMTWATWASKMLTYTRTGQCTVG